MILEAADRHPDGQAFVFGKESLTYSQLVEKASGLAAFLKERGTKVGDRIGVLLPPCIESPVAVYGSLLAGCAFVPLDPDAPGPRLEYAIRDCGISHVVTSDHLSGKLPSRDAVEQRIESLIGVDAASDPRTFSWEEVSEFENDDASGHGSNEDSLAYVMYTSGTTGEPKGIMHTNASGLAYARASRDLYGVSSSDRLANHSPLHFDISTMGYLTMPLANGTTVLLPDAHKKMPASLSQLLETEKITIWYSVPLALTQLVDFGAIDKRDLSSLRWILFGGEPFPTDKLKHLMDLLPHARYSNVYGPAEVNQCTFFNFDSSISLENAVPLGQVWEAAEGIVRGRGGSDVRNGEDGELLISSGTMMKGYWGREDLTASSVIRLRAADGEERLFYKTRDIVRHRPDGSLDFVGRADRQVKVRGYRVELNEIEAAIRDHDGISDCGVVVSEDSEEERSIRAFAALRNGITVSKEQVLEHLALSLPRYALPSEVLFVESIPRTPAGKIDYKALAR